MKLSIEKLVYGGEGLARVAEGEGRSKTVFVPFVFPGEEVEARIVAQKKSFAHARLEKVLAPSPQRVNAVCPYFQRCGGCHYQHMGYERQLEAKKVILLETLQRTGKLDWKEPVLVHSAASLHYRNRTRLRLGHENGFSMGYREYRSHRLVAVEHCPISSPLINRTLAAIWILGREGKAPTFIREIEFFANAEDNEILLELLVGEEPDTQNKKLLISFASAIKNLTPEMAGVCAFLQPGEFPVYDRMAWSEGKTSLTYRTKLHDYQVSGGSFFQSNRFLTDALVGLTTGGRSGKLALDLYAGTGLFSLPLATSFERVIAVEVAPASFADLKVNLPANVKAVRATTEAFLERKATLSPDVVVVDPPRDGLGDKVARSMAALQPREISYVSCDPATLSRDLRVLVESGYRVDSIHLVDLFPQTFHIETVVHLARS